MNSSNSLTARLVEQFYEFYSEVDRLVAAIKSGTRTFRAHKASPEDTDESRAVKVMWQSLLTLLERQALAAGQSGNPSAFELYREAQYVMAALADEIFIHMDWEGREIWNRNLLEFKLFQSRGAGEIFFQKLDRLLQSRDPLYVGVAEVYLLALFLGFRGKYRDADDGDRVRQYRQQLFSLIYHRDPNLAEARPQLFPEAYAHTLEQQRGKVLPAVRKWVLALVLTLVGFLALSHAVWIHLPADLDSVIGQILSKDLDTRP